MIFIRNFFVSTLCFIMLSSCSNNSKEVDEMIQGDTLIEQASFDDNSEAKIKHVFQATTKYINARLFNKAHKLLSTIDYQNLNDYEKSFYNFLNAKFYYENLKPNKAIAYLSKVDTRKIIKNSENSKEILKDFYKLKYQINYALNRNEAAVISQINFNKYIDNSTYEEFKDSNKEIWNNLIKLSKSQLLNLKQQNINDSNVQGWLDLALVFNTGFHGATEENSDASEKNEAQHKLKNWFLSNPKHVAVNLYELKNNKTPRKLKIDRESSVKKIALLLPMTGKYKKIADPIKLGFLSAYYSKKNNKEISITLVDSAKDYNINEINADVIVGPLLKNEVKNIIAQKKEDNIKVLALNYTKSSYNKNVYQFGISAEDEAEQAAVRTNNLGFQNTLIIAENSSWGERVAKAFGSKFEELNNTVTEKSFFEKNTDYQAKIRKLLGIDDANYRKYQLSKTLGVKLNYTPQRRKDIDNIFIAMPYSQAKQIVPLIKYFYAEDLPIFSTSSVYSESSFDNNNNDLTNVQFCDIPGNLPENIDKNDFDYKSYLTSKIHNPISNNRRIFALGIDAFNLALQLNQFEEMPLTVLNGVTGKLNLADHNKIKRNLPWAKVNKNKIIVIG